MSQRKFYVDDADGGGKTLVATFTLRDGEVAIHYTKPEYAKLYSFNRIYSDGAGALTPSSGAAFMSALDELRMSFGWIERSA